MGAKKALERLDEEISAIVLQKKTNADDKKRKERVRLNILKELTDRAKKYQVRIEISSQDLWLDIDGKWRYVSAWGTSNSEMRVSFRQAAKSAKKAAWLFWTEPLDALLEGKAKVKVYSIE